eukprot:1119913-Amphidinium_carterae.1
MLVKPDEFLEDFQGECTGFYLIQPAPGSTSPRPIRRTEIVHLSPWKANPGGPPIRRPGAAKNKGCSVALG